MSKKTSSSLPEQSQQEHHEIKGDADTSKTQSTQEERSEASGIEVSSSHASEDEAHRDFTP